MAQLKVLTLNVFFDPVAQRLRHREILSLAQRSGAQVLLFQEVTLPFLRDLQRAEWVHSGYECSDPDFSGSTIGEYGVCSLARQDLHPTFTFAPLRSRMGRRLLITALDLPPAPAASQPLQPAPPSRAIIGNVHLESLANHPTRVHQLQSSHAALFGAAVVEAARSQAAALLPQPPAGNARQTGRATPTMPTAGTQQAGAAAASSRADARQAGDAISFAAAAGQADDSPSTPTAASRQAAAAGASPLVILAGDFNFCSYRNFDGTLPLENDAMVDCLPEWQDVWEVLKDTTQEPGYTFDTVTNLFTELMAGGRYERMRYDRVMALCTPQSGSSWAPTDSYLVGTEEVQQAPEPSEAAAGTSSAPAPAEAPMAMAGALGSWAGGLKGKVERAPPQVFPSDHYGLLATFTCVPT